MPDQVLEQARKIHRVIQVLQSTMLRWYHEHVDGRGMCEDLTLPQFRTLEMIRERGEVTIKELAQALQVSSPSASAMVERLVEMGLSVREQSHEDRRAVHVRLTQEGTKALALHEEIFLLGLATLMERVGPDCSRQWCQVYERIRKVLEEEPGMASPVQPGQKEVL